MSDCRFGVSPVNYPDSVIIVRKSNCDLIDIVSIHLLTLVCITDFDR